MNFSVTNLLDFCFAMLYNDYTYIKEKKMKKFFQDFKKFISRGNILDLAVGVIVGGAFTAIVTALTNNIIRPLINWIIALIGGKEGLASAVTFLSKAYKIEDSKKVVDLANSIYIDWGAFITAIIDFFIIAFTIFTVLKIVMRSRELAKEATEQAKKKHLNKAERQELKDAGINIKDKEAVALYYETKQAEEDKRKAEEEERKKLEEEEKIKNSPEYLLREIRDLLKANQQIIPTQIENVEEIANKE